MFCGGSPLRCCPSITCCALDALNKTFQFELLILCESLRLCVCLLVLLYGYSIQLYMICTVWYSKSHTSLELASSTGVYGVNVEARMLVHMYRIQYVLVCWYLNTCCVCPYRMSRRVSHASLSRRRSRRLNWSS
jgi:hypothetical protein